MTNRRSDDLAGTASPEPGLPSVAGATAMAVARAEVLLGVVEAFARAGSEHERIDTVTTEPLAPDRVNTS